MQQRMPEDGRGHIVYDPEGFQAHAEVNRKTSGFVFNLGG